MIQKNPTSNQPMFEQIIFQIKMAVLKGYLKPGDSIPSVRKLALQLSVTPGTVAKAYSELEPGSHCDDPGEGRLYCRAKRERSE